MAAIIARYCLEQMQVGVIRDSIGGGVAAGNIIIMRGSAA